MSRELDQRDFSVSRASSGRDRELRAIVSDLSDQLPGAHRLRIKRMDALTGNPAVVASEHAPAEQGNYVQRALNHVQGISRALGLTPTQPVEYVADPDMQTTSSGSVAVHLHQMYKGIPVFQAQETVRFGPDGTLKDTTGTSVSVEREISATPRLSVQQAVLASAEHVATPDADEMGAQDPFGEPLPMPTVNLTGFMPSIIATFSEKPDRPTILEAGPFGDKIKASLLWFSMNEALSLTWEIIITMPDKAGQYRTLIHAETGEIVYCRQLMQAVMAKGNVFHVDGSRTRQMTDFPRRLTDYGVPLPSDLPVDFPDDWVNNRDSDGNSVLAHLGENGPTIQGEDVNGQLIFDPADATGDDQKVLNIFYYNCYMHDFFYLLGFREADGNFQRENLGRGGVASDRVDARAHSGAVFGTANMATPIDGSNPEMNMGLVTSTNRHTAFDSSVVFHEFMHGVTNRLVGGPMDARALDAIQSGGMGEGWGDYIACTINNSVVVGDWVVNNPGGIRGFAYDSNFPDTFGNIGTGRYDRVHNIGEIWCATLLELNRRIGKVLALQLVIDALKLSPSNPSFLDMRDALLMALDDKFDSNQLTEEEYQQAETDMWSVFAKFGMGPAAQSAGAMLMGIVPDFSPPNPEPPPSTENPVRVSSASSVSIPDNNPNGIRDIVTVDKTGSIEKLSLTVDIQHPYRGDLIVTLTSPSGKTAIVHNRTGASRNNLVKTYTSDTDASLARFIKEDAQGDWMIQVSDHAGADQGTLQKWELVLRLEQGRKVVRKEITPSVTIPDSDPNGVVSIMSDLAPSGKTETIKVALDITHTYIGDLKVELIAPTGESALLHNRKGEGQDNIIKTFDSLTTPDLSDFIGRPVTGPWELRVSDHAGQDIGKLNKWSLEVTLQD